MHVDFHLVSQENKPPPLPWDACILQTDSDTFPSPISLSTVMPLVDCVSIHPGDIFPVNTILYRGPPQGLIRPQYLPEHSCKTRHELDAGTRHLGKFGATTSIPVPDTSASSGRVQTRYPTLAFAWYVHHKYTGYRYRKYRLMVSPNGERKD